MNDFDLLRIATTLVTKETLFYQLVEDWAAKREIVDVMCNDLPMLVENYKNRNVSSYGNDSRYSIADRVPEVRLKAAVEATVNALYGLADVAANFGSKATHVLPASFNSLATKVENGQLDAEITAALGDVSWYQKVREIRTELAHHSTVFVGENDKQEVIFVVRDYRRPSDKKHFTETIHLTAAELIAWTKKALMCIESYGGYLAKTHVLPKLPKDKIIRDTVRDEIGFPKFGDNGLFQTREITIQQYFADQGVDLSQYQAS